MPIHDLPTELIIQILTFALTLNQNPISILRVNKYFLAVSKPILYSDLYFTSVACLSKFSLCSGDVTPPRTLNVVLAGGASNFHVFQHLRDGLHRCSKSTDSGNQVPLDLLSLCFHSHSRNPNLKDIYEALSLANPLNFSWSGPDPSHHFSIAIVPEATVHLFRAISHWSNLRSLKLTNISFPQSSPTAPLLPAIQSLRVVYLGQVTFLSPAAVAYMVLQPGTEGLEEVRLVDAYSLSIWNARIRRRDIEAVALAIPKYNHESEMYILMRVRDIVYCEARTERIMGGDRVEEGILE